MNFKTAKPNENFIYRELSEEGLIEIGIHPVMFGFRVRAGFVGNGWVELDWCCGNEQKEIEYIYSVLKIILTKKSEDVMCFDDLLSNSEIKPLQKDVKFMQWLVPYIPKDMKRETLPNLHELKREYINNVFN